MKSGQRSAARSLSFVLRSSVLKLLGAIAVASSIVTATPVLAAAHVGQGPIAILQAGPYTVQPFHATQSDVAHLERYPLTVFDGANRKAENVRVTVSARDASGRFATAPVEAVPSANGFLAQLPAAPAEGWTVTVAVVGALGSGSVSYETHSRPRTSATSPISLILKVVVGAFGLAVLATAIVVAARGRRTEDDAVAVQIPRQD